MKNKIVNAINDALSKMDIKSEIELTPSKGHGDFSTNIAMQLAGQLKDSPMNIANKIIDNIDKESNAIEKVEVAGPGFINFFMKKEVMNTIITDILEAGDDYGRGNGKDYINIEYVSANPTGYLHLGHARGAAVGSVLINVLRFFGHKVDAEYYVNDAGAQIDILGEAAYTRYLQAHGKSVEMPENTYKGQDIVWVAEQLKNLWGDKYVETPYNEVADIFKKEAKELLLSEIDKDLKSFGVEFDMYSSEQKMYDDNLIVPALEKLQDKYEQDGATWLKTTKYGDDKDRVLIKSDGSYTYFTPDIAFHNVKLSRGYDYIINIFGADHIGYIKRMEIALKQLGYPNALRETLVIQFVRLLKDGQELKMSKRMGTSFTLRELIEMIGKDAARFFMVNRSCDSKFDFKIELAQQKTSENPVYYIQYAHARANQILTKSEKEIETKNLVTDGAESLMEILAKFPELVAKIASNQKIHLLPQYLIDVARAFHSFYNAEKVIGSKTESSKLAIIKATKQVIKNGLSLLGITAPERM